MPKAPQSLSEFQSLVDIVRDLRGPDGCPWDRKQTHHSLTQYAIEEVFEFVEAVENQDLSHMKEELGDVLFQVVLHSQLASEDKNFDIYDVIQNLNEKMVRRHPHVFAEVKVTDANEVLKNWEEIKKEEKGSSVKERPFDIPVHLPALQRAQKIGVKTKKTGFDWSTPQEVWAKVEEEIEELKTAMANESTERQKQELGDVLFSLAQLARHLGFEPEQALRQTNQRFEDRYQKMQDLCNERKLNFEALSPEEKESLWRESKLSHP